MIAGSEAISSPSEPYKMIVFSEDEIPFENYQVVSTPQQSDVTTSLENAFQKTVVTAATDIMSIFRASEYEDFEDGMDSMLAENLTEMLNKKGNIAVAIISELILSNAVKLSVASQTLKILGAVDDPETHNYRRRVLEDCMLEHPSAYVKDGAVYGLTTMNDPASIPSLEKALEKESIPLLRHLIEIALNASKR